MPKSASHLRRSLRYEAARIMADEGVRDFRIAKEKACSRLGVSTHRAIPTNLEIENALEEQLSIFRSDRDIERKQYLETALSIMNLVSEYSPKLTGAAVTGVITSVRPVEVHVFPSTVEEVCELLYEADVPYDQIQKRKRFTGKRFDNIPGFEWTVAEVDVELFCFLPEMPYPPLSPITGKPIRSISQKKVKRLLE